MMDSLRVRLLMMFSIVVLIALGTVAILVSRATTTQFERSVAGIINYRYFDVYAKADAIQKAIYQHTGERQIWDELQKLLVGIYLADEQYPGGHGRFQLPGVLPGICL